MNCVINAEPPLYKLLPNQLCAVVRLLAALDQISHILQKSYHWIENPFFVLITLTPFYHPCLDGTQSMNPTSWQLDAVFSSILAILNSSLATSAVLSYFKHAIVQPLVHTPVLKKPGLDPTVLNSFRPVSKLLFYTRFYERMF